MNKNEPNPNGNAIIDQQTLQALGQAIDKGMDAAITGIDEALHNCGIPETLHQQALNAIVAGVAARTVSGGGELPFEQSINNTRPLIRQIVQSIHAGAQNRPPRLAMNDWEQKEGLDSPETQETEPATTEASNNNTRAINAAFVAGRDAIVKTLGRNASQDALADVIQLMAHCVLTQNKTLNATAARHNTTVFCEVLRAMVERTQHDKQGSHSGRLM